MGMQELATALRRARKVLDRRPDTGLHDDAPATASWQSGTRVLTAHDNGKALLTDMPSGLGGSGDQVSPGWLFRAGIASCAATAIVMAAAEADIELGALQVSVSSRSDTRGLLGMADGDGARVYAGPGEMRLQVRIAAPGVDPARLRALVEDALARSPIPNAVLNATPMALQIDASAA